MARKYFFFIEHPKCLDCPDGRVYFAEDEIKKANIFAQRLANELHKTVVRRDVNGGESHIHPAW
jgi:hypothetical protein